MRPIRLSGAQPSVRLTVAHSEKGDLYQSGTSRSIASEYGFGSDHGERERDRAGHNNASMGTMGSPASETFAASLANLDPGNPAYEGHGGRLALDQRLVSLYHLKPPVTFDRPATTVVHARFRSEPGLLLQRPIVLFPSIHFGEQALTTLNRRASLRGAGLQRPLQGRPRSFEPGLPQTRILWTDTLSPFLSTHARTARMGAVLSSTMNARQAPVPLFSPGSDPSLPLLTLTSDSRTILVRFPDSMADLEAKVQSLFGAGAWAFVVRTAHGEQVEVHESAFGALPVGGRVEVLWRGADGKRAQQDEAGEPERVAARGASGVESRIEVDDEQPTGKHAQRTDAHPHVDQALPPGPPLSPGSSATATETAHSPSADQSAPLPTATPTPVQLHSTVTVGPASAAQNGFAFSIAAPDRPISPTPAKDCTASPAGPPEQAEQKIKVIEFEDGEIVESALGVQSTGDGKVVRAASIGASRSSIPT